MRSPFAIWSPALWLTFRRRSGEIQPACRARARLCSSGTLSYGTYDALAEAEGTTPGKWGPGGLAVTAQGLPYPALLHPTSPGISRREEPNTEQRDSQMSVLDKLLTEAKQR